MTTSTVRRAYTTTYATRLRWLCTSVTSYSYVKNLQGDIVAILNSAGTVVVSYVYDAWGRPIATTGSMADTLGVLNPFRYRGYVFDEETGLYYLWSRYYATQLAKFITADTHINLLDKVGISNLYSYGGRTPVNTTDPAGTDAIWIVDYDSFSHVSLLIEDQNGTWYYFYWGAADLNIGSTAYGSASSAFGGSSSSGVSSGSGADSTGSSASSALSSGSIGTASNATDAWGKFVYLKLENVPFSDHSDVLHLINSNQKKTDYDGTYDDYYYFHGDYSASHNRAYRTLTSTDGNRWPYEPYDLFTNNCVQASIDLLMFSAQNNPELKYLDGLREMVVPGFITYKLWNRLGK